MKVWLDDERQAPTGWLHVKTPQDAIRMLQTGRVTEISLDNDLGLDGVYPNEGRHVADWIEKAAATKEIKRVVVHIHTQNPIAAAKMRVAINNANRYWDL